MADPNQAWQPTDTSGDYQKMLDSLPPIGGTSPVSAPPRGINVAPQSQDAVLGAAPSALNEKPAEPEDGTNYADMPWGTVLASAVHNAPASAGNVFSGFGHMLAHPLDTLGTVGKVAEGAGSELYDYGRKQFGLQPTNFAGEQQSQALVDALGQHYADTYGSVGGFKKAIATDPFSIGMDAASVIPGVGEATGASGLLSKMPILEKAASIAGDVANPIQGAISVAKSVGSGVGGIAGKAADTTMSGLSGLPPYALQAIRAVGASSDLASKEAFTRFVKGVGDPSEISDAASNAVSELKNQASQAYLQNSKNRALVSTELPTTDITDSLSKMNQDSNFAGNPHLMTAHESNVAQQVNDAINHVISNPDPTARTMDGLDHLKQGLNNLAGSVPGSNLQGTISDITTVIQDTINAQDPTYGDMLENYAQARNQLKNFQSTLGATPGPVNKVSTANQLGRMMRAMKTPSGQDLLTSLSQTQAGKDIPYMLAGSMAHPFVPDKIRALGDAATLGGLAYLAHPAAMAPLALTALTASPRLTSGVNLGAGMAKRATAPLMDMGRPVEKALTSIPGTYVGSMGEQLDENGRIGKKYGGAISHEDKADWLIREAEKAHRSNAETTKPFLNEKDETIMKALKIANKGI